MDGVLIDSEPVAAQAWRTYLSRYGHTLEERVYERMVGLRLSDSAKLVAQHYGLPVPPEEVAQARDALFLDLILRDPHPMPGLHRLLEALSGRGLRLAVATSAHQGYAPRLLTALNIRQRFEVIVTGDQVEHGKPAPDIYLHAASRLGLEPRACLVIEDAPQGVAAAKAAGMACVAVPNTTTMQGDFQRADAIVRDGLPGVLSQLDTLLALIGI
jgi:HAD superfamily hydrolase (TIGR01509 family)